MKIIVQPAARDDLRDIWRFGALTWGLAQADRYSDRLDSAIQSLAEHPRKGPNVDDIRPGLRRLVVGSHVIFYRAEGSTLRIIRILHGSRDAGRQVD